MSKRIGMMMRPIPVVLTVLVSVAGLGMAQQEKPAVDQEALQWLRDIQSNVVQIIDHANKLETMTHSPGTYPRPSHEFELLEIRARINDIGDLVPRLQNRAGAPQWQKEIVDEVASLLAAMATQTEKAIEVVRADPVDPTVAPVADLGLNSNSYEARVVGIGHYAEHINELVGFADTRVERKRQQERTQMMSSS